MRSRIVVLVLFFTLALPALVAARRAADPTSTAPARLFLPHISSGGGSDSCGDFHDDFSAANGWFTGERDGLLAELREGEYRLLVTRPGFVWIVGAPGCARVDDRAAVDARWGGPPGNFYGLLLTADGRLDRALMLAVNSEARVWLLFRVSETGLTTLSGPTFHEAIRPGNATNRLAMTRGGGRIVLSVNGAAVGDVADPLASEAVTGGLVAASYSAHAPADARFDDFVHEGEKDELRIRNYELGMKNPLPNPLPEGEGTRLLIPNP